MVVGASAGGVVVSTVPVDSAPVLLSVSVLVLLSPSLDVVVPEVELLVPETVLPLGVPLVAENPLLPVGVVRPIVLHPPLLGEPALRVGIVHVPRLRLTLAVPPGKGSGVLVHVAGSGAALKSSL